MSKKLNVNLHTVSLKIDECELVFLVDNDEQVFISFNELESLFNIKESVLAHWFKRNSFEDYYKNSDGVAVKMVDVDSAVEYVVRTSKKGSNLFESAVKLVKEYVNKVPFARLRIHVYPDFVNMSEGIFVDDIRIDTKYQPIKETDDEILYQLNLRCEEHVIKYKSMDNDLYKYKFSLEPKGFAYYTPHGSNLLE